MKRIRLIIAAAAPFLILGALLNIGTAWWAAATFTPVGARYRPDLETTIVTGEAPPRWRANWFRRLGTTRIYWTAEHPSTPVGPWPRARFEPGRIPGWSRVADDPLPDDPGATALPVQLWEDGHGWPFASLTCVYETSYAFVPGLFAPTAVHGAIALNESEWSVAVQPRSLPMRVLPVGTLANTLVWAALVFIAWRLMWLGIRRARQERGFCPMCRYIVGRSHGASCPECGWRAPLSTALHMAASQPAASVPSTRLFPGNRTMGRFNRILYTSCAVSLIITVALYLLNIWSDAENDTLWKLIGSSFILFAATGIMLSINYHVMKTRAEIEARRARGSAREDRVEK